MEVREFVASLVAGGMAGMCVDLTLFPLDTMKTRLQSQQGFYKAGGFRGIYAGVPSAAIGSFPNAALFFVTYECTKSMLGPQISTKKAPLLHMFAASLGEVVACLIRVPTEVVKQRSQACPTLGTYKVFIETIKQEGILGLYRGFGSTVKREIPFALVQFPLWEFLKALWSWKQNHAVDSWQSAVCGAFAGGFAAAVTTPLDVAKTRIMLAKKGTTTASGKVLPTLSNIWKTRGISGCLFSTLVGFLFYNLLPFYELHTGANQAQIVRDFQAQQLCYHKCLFSGIIPRVTWISLGGFLFLGTYDKIHKVLL